MESVGGQRQPQYAPGQNPPGSGVVSAGRRAGAPMQAPSGQYSQGPPPGAYPPGAADNGARFGRRASPPASHSAGVAPPLNRATSLTRAASPSSANRTAGLQQLKQNSAGSRPPGSIPGAGNGGYVPSAAQMSPVRTGVGPPGMRPSPIPSSSAAQPPGQRPQGMPMQANSGAPQQRPAVPPQQQRPPGAPGQASAPGVRAQSPSQFPRQPPAGGQVQQQRLPGMAPPPSQAGSMPRGPPAMPQQQQQQQMPPQQRAPPPAAAGPPPAGGAGLPAPSNNRLAALAALAARKQQNQQAPQQQLQSPAAQQQRPAPQPQQQYQQQQQPQQQQQRPPPQQQQQYQQPAQQQRAPPQQQQQQQQQRPPPQQQQQYQQPPQQQRAPPQQQYQQQQQQQRPPPQRAPPRVGGTSLEDMPVAGSGGFNSIPPELLERPSGPMIECQSCGRSFNDIAYPKHAKVCAKVFCQKRKVFNMTAARVEGTDAAKFVGNGKGKQPARAGAGSGRAGDSRVAQSAAASSKKAKWKQQSDQLRAAMKTSRMIQEAQAKGLSVKDIPFQATDPDDDDRVPCPHCGRKFAPLTADRHIPMCKNTVAKPSFQKAGAGRGAHAARR